MFLLVSMSISLAILLASPHMAHAGAPSLGMPGAFPGFDPNMSEEQLISQLMKEIDAALPEDQREAFWEEVARETERIEDEMNKLNLTTPAEREQYLLNLMSEEEPEPVEPAIQKPKTESVEPQKEVSKTKPSSSLEQDEEALKLIQQLTKAIENFLSKVAAFPDFDGRAIRWIQKGSITDWQAENWAHFIHELNKFVNLLQRFKEKDPSFGFKHLHELMKDEAVMQNLKRLHTKLMDYEAKIKINPFEVASMSTATKNAFIHSINALTESLYRTKAPQDLQKIIEIFDPIAKKIREQEESAAKEALSTSKKLPSTVPVKTAGKPEERYEFALPKLEDFGLTGGRVAPRPSRQGGPRQEAEAPKKEDGKKGPATKEEGKKTTDEKAKEAADKKKQEDESKKKKQEESKEIKHPGIKKNIEDAFKKDIEEASNIIFETPEFQTKDSLKDYLQLQTAAPSAT